MLWVSAILSLVTLAIEKLVNLDLEFGLPLGWRGERKGVNETPQRGGSVVVCSVPWTGSLFIAAEVGFGPS